MPDAGPENVIHRLVTGDADTVSTIVATALTSDDPVLLVAVALFVATPHEFLDRAATAATSARDRQLVAIAQAHVAGERDRVDALARDHLADHPDSVLVSWIAADRGPSRKDRT